MKRLTLRNSRETTDAQLVEAVSAARGPSVLVLSTATDLASLLRERLGAKRRLVHLRWGAAPNDAPDSFNPLDTIGLVEKRADIDLIALFDPIFERLESTSELVDSSMPNGDIWTSLARALLPAVIRSNLRPGQKPALVECLYPLFADDIIYKLAVILDTRGKTINPNDYATIATFLQLSDNQRTALLSAIFTIVAWVNEPHSQRLTESTSFDLADVLSGSPVILIEVPPEAGEGGRMLARLWLSALCGLAMSRRHDLELPLEPTLLIADGTLDPGLMQQLLVAQRCPAGVFDVWSLWESLDQVRVPNPRDWVAFVDGCDIVEATGPQGPAGAAALAEAFGADRDALLTLSSGQTLVLSESSLVVPASPRPEGWQPPSRGHLAIFGGGSGKWDAIAAGIVARPQCPVIVLDPHGECYRKAAADRIGPIIRLDPYQLTGSVGDRFNPWDVYALLEGRFSAAHRLGEALVAAGAGSNDPFWRHASISLIRATLQYLAIVPEKENTLAGVLDTLRGDDVVYNLAVVLDTIGGKLPKWCYQEIAGFLQLADSTRTRILAEAQKDLLPFAAAALRDATAPSSFDVATLLDGPVTVFIQLGRAADEAGSILARLWLSSFVQLIAMRRACEHPVLLIADASPYAGMLPQLLTVQRLPKGSAELWSLWETIDQLSATDPASWAAFIDNCDGVLAVGPQGSIGARGLAEMFRADQAALRAVEPGQSLILAGTAPLLARPKLKASGSAVCSGRGPGHNAIFAPAASTRCDHVASIIAASVRSPLVIFETSGELYRRTAPGRTGRVVQLDPFQVIGSAGDRFNPLAFPGRHSASLAQARNRLIETLLPPDNLFRQPYWRTTAANLLDALAQCVALQQEPTVAEMRRLMIADETKELTSLAEAAEKHPATRLAAKVLFHALAKGDAERTSIFAVASHALYDFADPAIEAATSGTSFDPEHLFCAEGSALYVEIPPMDGEPARRLARIWLEGLVPFLRASAATPLLVIDSPLSSNLLQVLIDHRNDREFDVLAIWDSPDQFGGRGPGEWDAYLSSLRRAEALGPLNRHACLRIAERFGSAIETLEALADGEICRL